MMDLRLFCEILFMSIQNLFDVFHIYVRRNWQQFYSVNCSVFFDSFVNLNEFKSETDNRNNFVTKNCFDLSSEYSLAVFFGLTLSQDDQQKSPRKTGLVKSSEHTLLISIFRLIRSLSQKNYVGSRNASSIGDPLFSSYWIKYESFSFCPKDQPNRILYFGKTVVFIFLNVFVYAQDESESENVDNSPKQSRKISRLSYEPTKKYRRKFSIGYDPLETLPSALNYDEAGGGTKRATLDDLRREKVRSRFSS